MKDNDTERMEALNRLVVAQQAALRGFVRSLGVHPDSVDDLAQEVFLRAWRHMDRFDERRDYGKWLRGIARNVVRNERSARQRHERILSNRLADILETNQWGRVDTVFRDTPALLSALRGCLSRLSQKQQSLLKARYADYERVTTLAVGLTVTPSSLRQRLSRLRKALRKCVESKMGGSLA